MTGRAGRWRVRAGANRHRGTSEQDYDCEFAGSGAGFTEVSRLGSGADAATVRERESVGEPVTAGVAQQAAANPLRAYQHAILD
jgi:hypothetical protein